MFEKVLLVHFKTILRCFLRKLGLLKWSAFGMIRRAGEEEKRWKEEEGTAKGDEAEVIPSWGHGLCREFPSTAYFTKQDIYM